MPITADVPRRDPSRSVVNRVLREHLETFLARFVDAHGGRTLPAHVERELRAAITCRDLAHGFWRVRCPSCALDHLVAFSSKGRGFCPSCCGRRMAEVAAHLSSNVVPYVPVRQWVLSLPWELRFRLIADPDLCRAVASAFLGAVFAHQVRVAKAAGHCLGPESYAHPGAVNFLQKFGSALQVNPHFHALVIDGVYVTERPGAIPTFHPAPPLTDLDVARVQADAQARIERVLRACGLLARDGADPEPLEGYEDSALPGLWSASLLSQAVAVSGCSELQKVPRLVDPGVASAKCEALELPRGALVASSSGYSLHAATRVDADDRDALERLIRYMARPPLSQGRLMLREDGKVLWNLRRPWRDGTRAFVFDPLTFIGRLAALVPHVREHQLTYHGCLAPASPLRDHVVPRPPSSRPSRCAAAGAAPNQPSEGPKFSWAELMMRVWSKDVLKCPRCGSRRLMLAAITDGPTITRILAHLGLPTEPLPIAPAREPPQLEFAW